MPKLNIRGGSAGEPTRTFQSPFFQAEVKSLELRTKDVYKLRLLPAFNRDILPDDPSYKISYLPYRRTNGDIDKVTQTPAFTDWYYIMQGYTWLGRQGKGFLSPLNLHEGPMAGGIDPIADCLFYARRHEDPSVKALAKKPENVKNAKAIIPSTRRFCFFNAYAERENAWDVYACWGSQTTLEDLKTQLAIKGGRGDQIISPAFQEFLYGDVTDPQEGLLATVKKGTIGIGNQTLETSLFTFSKNTQSLDGAELFPYDPASEAGQAILAARYDFMDDTVVKVATYQEILDYIVEDGTIPYWLIEEACSNFGTLAPEPASSKAAVHSLPPVEAAEDQIPGAEVPPAPAAQPVRQPVRPAVPVAAPSKPAGVPTRPAAPAPLAKPVAAAAAPAAAPRPVQVAARTPAPVAAPKAAVPPHAIRQVQKPAPAPVKTSPALTAQAVDTTSPEAQADLQRYTDLSTRLANGEDLSDEELRDVTALSAKFPNQN